MNHYWWVCVLQLMDWTGLLRINKQGLIELSVHPCHKLLVFNRSYCTYLEWTQCCLVGLLKNATNRKVKSNSSAKQKKKSGICKRLPLVCLIGFDWNPNLVAKVLRKFGRSFWKKSMVLSETSSRQQTRRSLQICRSTPLYECQSLQHRFQICQRKMLGKILFWIYLSSRASYLLFTSKNY